MKAASLLVTLAIGVFPVVAAAQFFEPIDEFLGNVVGFINSVLVPLIFTLALLFFIYGMFKYFILKGDSEGDREKGKQLMLSAVVGFVLMVSIWGIVNLVAGGLQAGLGANRVPELPGIPQPVRR
jgi:uncharacterized membrane protein YraQ (UPF0718 family)